MKNKIKTILFLAVCFSALPVFAYYNPGMPKGLVNDYAKILSENERSALEQKLSALEKETGHEVAIVIIQSLKEDTIENFGEQLFKEWGIGKKGEDNGILFLIALEDRKTRIEVGYGLEGALTDAQSYWILEKVVKPAFQKENYYKGIDSAIDNIISAIQGEEIPSLEETADKNARGIINLFILLSGAFIWGFSLILRLGRTEAWWLGGVVGGVAALVIGLIFGFVLTGLLAFVILIPFGLLIDYFLSKKLSHKFKAGTLPFWATFFSSGSGKGGGSSGFGGFGGGGSGAGGSSGSW